jgi:pimeloyl-ACP methyl ester carboxylesterase
VDPKSEIFNTGTVELAYSEWPGESPPVVFLHGMTTGRAFWSPARIELRGQQRALAYDARGHGDSARAPSYRYTEFGDDAVSFLEGVCREPAILVGHSLGAMTAVYAAAARPDLVVGVMLIDPPLYAQYGPRDEKEAFEQRRALAGKPVDEVVAGGLPAHQGAANVSKLDGEAVAYDLDGRAFEGWDIEAMLQRLRCPVLLEHGERGVGEGLGASTIYEGEIERASALIKNCTVVQIKGSGHIPMAQQPEEFARVTADFIQRMVGAYSNP